MSETKTEIFKALQLAQTQFKPVHKTKQGYGYKYAPLDAVVDAVKDALKANGLFFTQSVYKYSDGMSLVTILGHVSGQSIENGCPILLYPNNKNPMQDLGSAITYARRYGLSAILGIVTEEDTDAATVQDNAPKAKETPKDTRPTMSEFMAKQNAGAVNAYRPDEEPAKPKETSKETKPYIYENNPFHGKADAITNSFEANSFEKAVVKAKMKEAKEFIKEQDEYQDEPAFLKDIPPHTQDNLDDLQSLEEHEVKKDVPFCNLHQKELIQGEWGWWCKTEMGKKADGKTKWCPTRKKS